MTVQEPEAESAVTELVRESRRRRRLPLARRALLAEVLVGGGFLAAAVALAVLADGPSDVEAGPAIVLVVCLALAGMVYIEVGGTYTSPLQLVLVPMLLLLPPQLVPLLVAAGLLLSGLPGVVRGRAHPDRLLNTPGDGWFALGPALVLVLFDVSGPDWGDWPVYLLALAAQFGLDAVVSPLRERLAEGTPPRLQYRVLLTVDGIDLLLSPVGLLAAFASQMWEYAFVLLVPPTALLTLYARERTRRLSAALQLSDAVRERQALIAGASHDLVTPTAVLVGLTERLATGRRLPEGRRAQLDAVMHQEALALRQVIRQFVDYTRIKTERDLMLDIRPVDLRALAATLARATVSDELPPVRADAERLHQMLTSLVADVLRGVTRSATATIAATRADGQVAITVTGPAAPRRNPFDETGGSTGVGRYVTAELARAHGGTVGLAAGPAGGSRYTLRLSAG